MKTFTTKELGDLMGDVNVQPDWRTPARKCCAYYDGEQLPSEVKKMLEDAGMPLLVYNLIKPTVNGVLGMEARTRTDMIISSDTPSDDFEDLVEAVNEKYKDTRRLCDADMAESDAYAGMIKAGLGWVEVYRNPYPMQTPYKILFVHRDEVFWDWNTKQRDMSDCRWIKRDRWLDLDEALSMMPDKKELINRAVNNDWEKFIGETSFTTAEGNEVDYQAAWAEYQTFSRSQTEWFQEKRRRILLQIVYYAVIERKMMMFLQNGRVEEYDTNNLVHNALVASGKAELKNSPVRYIREAWFVGPIKCRDKICDAPQGNYPLVPFWGYRKDSNNMPMGMITDMITPQDAVNFRYIKLTAQLNNKSVVMDDDATDMSVADVKTEINKVDGIIKLNPDRRNRASISEVFQVGSDVGIAPQQFTLAKDSQEMIQQCAGIYNAMLGEGTTGQSGVAIASLVEQGSTGLSEINDNHRYARLQVNRLLMLFMFEDMSKQRDIAVTVFKDQPDRRKTVIINQSDAGSDKLNNNISRLRANVALAPIQQTATFKAQMAQQLTQIIGTLPPEVQLATLDMVLSLMDIPNKQEFLGRVRSAIGVKKDFDKMTPEEQQQAQQQAQAEAEQQKLMMRKMAAEVFKEEADAASKQADADLKAKKLQAEDADIGKTKAETAKIVTELETQSNQQLIDSMGVIAKMNQALAQVQI